MVLNYQLLFLGPATCDSVSGAGDGSLARLGCVPPPIPSCHLDSFHRVVNPLAGDEHLKEVIQQLQLMGEVVYLKCEQEGLIILNHKWLFSTVCGLLLFDEFRNNALMSGS